MARKLGLLAVGALAFSGMGLFTGGTARAEDSAEASPFIDGEPAVWMDNCPFDARRPHAMRCLSKSLVKQSVAEARLRKLSAAPDAGEGVDASAEIGTCNGQAPGGGGGGTPSGLTATNYKKLYNLPTTAIGAGKIVAIVDACSNPGVVSDLAAYRSKFSLGTLPECGGADGTAPTPGGTACIGVVGQRGDANIGPADSSWSTEISLDVEMVSAACPECSILLVEADSPNSWDLGPAVSQAVALGASAVSNSYGAPEDPSDPLGPNYSDGPYAQYYNHPGVLIAVASGDDLYNNQTLASQDGNVLAPSFPSTVASVLSVGGTQTTASSGSTRGYTEAVWNQGNGGSTSGCSTEAARPSYQVASTPARAPCARTRTSRPRRPTSPCTSAAGRRSAGRAPRLPSWPRSSCARASGTARTTSSTRTPPRASTTSRPAPTTRRARPART